jgi:hypothetical protein
MNSENKSGSANGSVLAVQSSGSATDRRGPDTADAAPVEAGRCLGTDSAVLVGYVAGIA